MTAFVRVFIGASLWGLVPCLTAGIALADDTPGQARGKAPSSPYGR